MDEKVYLEKLEKREIKPTAIRLLILKAMTRFTRAFSLLDLETVLDTVDKSTIFRTINLFLDHHLIHVNVPVLSMIFTLISIAGIAKRLFV